MKRLAGSLILLAGLVDLILGLAALAGAERLEANIVEIQNEPGVGGDLYFSLGVWGAVILAVGFGLAYGGLRLFGNGERDRLIGLITAYFALLPGFISLAIFRWPQLGVIVTLLSAIVLLTYRVPDPEEDAAR